MLRKTLGGTFLVLLVPFLINTTRKNSCATYFDYLLVNFGGNCHYDDNVDLDVPEIIQKYTRSVEIYNVTTDDGYILKMFRIFRRNPVGVVLLQPPGSGGSMAYLSDGADSLGIVLWNKGYDVWLSNHRGASYSRKHVNLTDSDPQFWDFSFHEIALHDLDAQFKIIKGETCNSKVIFIGYSMAATEALIYASLKPESAQSYVQDFILIAPLAYLKHFSSSFKYLFYVMKWFKVFISMGEQMTFEIIRWLAKPVTVIPYVVNIMTSVVMGWTPTEMDPVLYPYIFAHHERGMSVKMIQHYGQIYFNSSHFLMYDYGQLGNKRLYDSGSPPVYPLRNINSSMYVIYGDKDRLSTPLDIKKLCEEILPKDKVRDVVEIPNHNHIDYIFSRHRRKKSYETLFAILDRIKQEK